MSAGAAVGFRLVKHVLDGRVRFWIPVDEESNPVANGRGEVPIKPSRNAHLDFFDRPPERSQPSGFFPALHVLSMYEPCEPAYKEDER